MNREGKRRELPVGWRESRIRCVLDVNWNTPPKPAAKRTFRDGLSPGDQEKFDALPPDRQAMFEQSQQQIFERMKSNAKPAWTFCFPCHKPVNENTMCKS